jgi:type II secretory pathway pseudopilin PulG
MKMTNTKTSTLRWGRSGLTLIELTLVISALLIMIGTTMYFGGNLSSWKKGKAASESLRSVYAAQRGFLADHPRRTLASLTEAELIKYLPTQADALPTIVSLDDATLTIDIHVSPPVCLDSGGAVYDPSNKQDDSLWDVGI